jgi:hypothetical protein
MQVPTPAPAFPPRRLPLQRFSAQAASRRSAAVALGFAAGVHALALVLVLSAARDGRTSGAAAARAAPAELVAYVEVDAWPGAPAGEAAGTASAPAAADPAGRAAEAAPAITQASADGAVTRPAGAPGAAIPPQQGPGAGGQAPSASGRARLGPELGDTRLVVPRGQTAVREPLEDEPYLAEFRAAARAFNDSIQDLADRERRAASWTWTDPDGRVWGFRQGKLVIAGEKTINVEMAGDRDQDALGRLQARQRREGADQAERLGRERYIRERGRAVRERESRARVP